MSKIKETIFERIGAGLACQLLDENITPEDRLSVWISTTKPLTPIGERSLRRLGVRVPGADIGIYTATLTPYQIGMLSRRSWVVKIERSRQLHYVLAK